MRRLLLSILIPLAGECERGAALGSLAWTDFLANRFVDSRLAQRLAHPARAVAAPQQAARAGAGECGIVDIAELDIAFDERGELRLAFPPPSPARAPCG